ncbi:MAG: hypothetical protein KAT37_02855 [Candidatus Aenigmarchaeota archaeon]|nr:hypothetical protein [Candidatus Aenigmarchaeota archaeon]
MDLEDAMYSAQQVIEMFGNINWLLDARKNNPKYPWTNDKLMGRIVDDGIEMFKNGTKSYVKESEYKTILRTLEENREKPDVGEVLEEWYSMEKEFFKNLE